MACLGKGDGSLLHCTDIVGEIVGDQFIRDSVELGDMNADGHLDAVFNQGDVCLGDGSGGFLPCVPAGRSSSEGGVALGDLDVDGNLDAVFANKFVSLVSNRVCLGDGDGGFRRCSDISEDSTASLDVALGHLNRDGNLDIVFSDAETGARVCLGKGDGSFLPCRKIDAGDGLTHSFGVALGDLNNDRDLDIVLAAGDGRGGVCLGKGDGSFFPCRGIITVASITDVELGFVDHDRNLDAVFANSADDESDGLCLLGDGEGGFINEHTGYPIDLPPEPPLPCDLAVSGGHQGVALAAGDRDGDGVADDRDGCVDSDRRDVVVIAGADTGLDNRLTDARVPGLFYSTAGCTLADLVTETAATATSRAEFLRDLQLVLRALVKDQTLTFADAQTLRVATIQAPFPLPSGHQP